MPVVAGLNTFANVCGYFNGQTPVNNGYGCNHPHQEEWDLVRLEKNEQCYYPKKDGDDLKRQILNIALRKKYGSYDKIIAATKTKSGQNYVKKVREKLLYDNDFLAQFNCKKQGRCYSFSCPLANECDLEDLKNHDTSLYENWKDEEYGPDESGAQLMLIHDDNFIKRL